MSQAGVGMHSVVGQAYGPPEVLCPCVHIWKSDAREYMDRCILLVMVFLLHKRDRAW